MSQRNSKIKCLIFLRWEILYTIIAIIYLFLLNKLNNELNSICFPDPIELIAYGNFKPVYYCTWALFLFIVGGIIITYRIITVIRNNMEFEEIIMTILGAIVCIILLVLIFYFINNPILRTIIAVVGVGFSTVYALTK